MLLQILGVLEKLQLKNNTDPAELHLFLETLKFGYGRRMQLGDPKFIPAMDKIEADIVDPKSIERVLAKIDRVRESGWQHGAN